MSDHAVFRIGLLGPARVGKTSLITALLSEAHELLAGSGVVMKPVGAATEGKIAENRADLDGDILAGEFTPGSLRGTVEPFVFELALDPGVPGAEIGLELLDFPGGWLTPKGRGSHSAEDWEECRRFITHSTVLLIPVDAALLMEAFEGEHLRMLPRLLTTAQVEQVAREWAVERNRRPDEPALVLFCPVKCESYFKDNGGRRDKSPELRRRFDNVYSGIIQAIRAEAPEAEMLYIPVDTIGCVEMISADWLPDEKERLSCRVSYRVRKPPVISRKGVDDVMTALARQLIQGKRMAAQAEKEERRADADQAWELARRREGFFRDIWLWLSGERELRRQVAEQRDWAAQEALRRVEALDAVLEKIANRGHGKRVHKL